MDTLGGSWPARAVKGRKSRDIVLERQQVCTIVTPGKPVQVQQTLANTYKAMHMSGSMVSRLQAAEKQVAAISVQDLCCACHMPLSAKPRCSVPHGAWLVAHNRSIFIILPPCFLTHNLM
jgi:hypothetical protein